MKQKGTDLSRRDALKLLGSGALGLGLVGAMPHMVIAEGVAVIPASKGYLLVDTKKCAGCMSCMLACSLVHEGRESLSLSRIQVLQDPLGKFPDDLDQAQCRQCVEPECVANCPTEALALFADPNFGNVRRVDKNKCISCLNCLDACPFTPSRALYNFEDGYAIKCDLCADTPHWKRKGGPGGSQACISVCPVKAIAYTEKIPVQQGDQGYDVNLRNRNWGKLGFPTT